jgi:DNA helicase IV
MGSQIDENILIAAYIERFTRFVEWPANNSVNNKSKPFVIAVSNNYELYLKLTGLAPSLKIKDKKIEIVLIKTIEDINSNINLLFVGMKDKEKLKQIVKKCADFSILTISNSNGFALKGVIINLYNQENSIRFEINDRKARESGLKISHLLLQKSKIVD